jgi:hypothetical protein
MIKGFIATLAVLGAATAAQAGPNLVVNGGFEQLTAGSPVSFEFGDSFNYKTNVIGWASPSTTAYNLLFNAGNTDARNFTRYPGEAQKIGAGYTGPSPNGGNFMAIDGDSNVRGPLQQLISGLTPGAQYELSFYWAATQLSNRTGPTTERFDVTFGSDTFSTATLSIPTQGFDGWHKVTHNFTASSASQLLSFLSIGTPNGLPPVALLDGVSLTAVPEPMTWAMMLAGFGAIGLAARRRQRPTVTLA